jgi:hypothetical protein
VTNLNRQNAKHAARAAKGNAQKNNMMRTMCASYFLAAHIVRLAYFNAVQRTFFLLKYRLSGFS